jgi:hypothetical protein
MNIADALNIEDLRRMAKRRLPRIAFDFIEGGVEDERCLARNETSFSRHRLLPHYLVDISKRDQSTTLFDRTYASPFGISPTGLAALFRPGADLMLAESAAAANVPFIMSGSSTASIEAAARTAPEHLWYQLYTAQDSKITEDLVRRARRRRQYLGDDGGRSGALQARTQHAQRLRALGHLQIVDDRRGVDPSGLGRRLFASWQTRVRELGLVCPVGHQFDRCREFHVYSNACDDDLARPGDD